MVDVVELREKRISYSGSRHEGRKGRENAEVRRDWSPALLLLEKLDYRRHELGGGEVHFLHFGRRGKYF